MYMDISVVGTFLLLGLEIEESTWTLDSFEDDDLDVLHIFLNKPMECIQTLLLFVDAVDDEVFCARLQIVCVQNGVVCVSHVDREIKPFRELDSRIGLSTHAPAIQVIPNRAGRLLALGHILLMQLVHKCANLHLEKKVRKE